MQHETEETETMYSPKELEQMLIKMDQASSEFYSRSVQVGNHAFIEFTGLLNEYINICRTTMLSNKDFTMANIHTGQGLQPKPHQVKYLAEKFECIFGTTLRDPENKKIFFKEMGWT